MTKNPSLAKSVMDVAVTHGFFSAFLIAGGICVGLAGMLVWLMKDSRKKKGIRHAPWMDWTPAVTLGDDDEIVV